MMTRERVKWMHERHLQTYTHGVRDACEVCYLCDTALEAMNIRDQFEARCDAAERGERKAEAERDEALAHVTLLREALENILTPFTGDYSAKILDDAEASPEELLVRKDEIARHALAALEDDD